MTSRKTLMAAPALVALALVALALVAMASPALAHTGVGSVAGLGAGAVHPLSGLDHLLAMVAVGLWASQLGGRALWLVPASFVAFMLIGGGLGMAGTGLPMVEIGIALSVVALGVMVATRARLPLVAGMAVAGLFALFHGHAHGAELPAGSGAIVYAAGFALATTGLHALGLGAGLALRGPAGARVLRVGGASCAILGLILLL